jgi:hypothetical protein
LSRLIGFTSLIRLIKRQAAGKQFGISRRLDFSSITRADAGRGAMLEKLERLEMKFEGSGGVFPKSEH